MNEPGNALHRLATIADDIGQVQAPVDAIAQLTAMCRTARLALGAPSASIARLDGDELVYEAADGVGTDAIVGLRLPLTRGLASFVVRTGQSLVVEQVERDPRFARDVAERVGYVPTSMLVTPIIDARGRALGALSVLDRSRTDADALQVASSVADEAAFVLPQLDLAALFSTLFFGALAEIVASDDEDVAGALRAAAGAPSGSFDDLAAMLAELRELPPEARAVAVRIVSEFSAYTSATRRRR